MSLDINKIIHDSINESKVEETSDEIQPIFETETIVESETNFEETSNNTGNSNQMCVASAISAGLGAMTLRNHLRSLNEISDENKARLKKAAKVGAGVAGAGAAGYAAYRNREDLAKLGRRAVGFFKKKAEATDDAPDDAPGSTGNGNKGDAISQNIAAGKKMAEEGLTKERSKSTGGLTRGKLPTGSLVAA